MQSREQTYADGIAVNLQQKGLQCVSRNSQTQQVTLLGVVDQKNHIPTTLYRLPMGFSFDENFAKFLSGGGAKSNGIYIENYDNSLNARGFRIRNDNFATAFNYINAYNPQVNLAANQQGQGQWTAKIAAQGQAKEAAAKLAGFAMSIEFAARGKKKNSERDRISVTGKLAKAAQKDPNDKYAGQAFREFNINGENCTLLFSDKKYAEKIQELIAANSSFAKKELPINKDDKGYSLTLVVDEQRRRNAFNDLSTAMIKHEGINDGSKFAQSGDVKSFVESRGEAFKFNLRAISSSRTL